MPRKHKLNLLLLLTVAIFGFAGSILFATGNDPLTDYLLGRTEISVLAEQPLQMTNSPAVAFR